MIGNPGNWGHTNHEWFGLEALKWNEKPVFDVLAIRNLKNGFEIEFTEPISSKTKNWKNLVMLSTWTYKPTMSYGGPKIDLEEFAPDQLWLSNDRKKIIVEIEKLKEGYVYNFVLNDSLQSQNQRSILSTKAWYTLNNISNEKRNLKEYLSLVKKPVVNTKTISRTQISGPKPKANVQSKADPKAEATTILEGSKLIMPSGCNACHRENEKILGPSFKAIAQKYSNDPATVKKLVDKVYNGGSGVWGDYAMAAQSHLKKDQIEKMVKWVLSLK
jgi:cytochrome c551/c552